MAEEAGVKLALHPDDPPVPMLGGVARIFRSFEGFKRAMETVPSAEPRPRLLHGLLVGDGAGRDRDADASTSAERGKIFYVHFRDVQGVDAGLPGVLPGRGQHRRRRRRCVTLKEAGFTGFLIDDHVPHMVDDTPWGHRGRAQATGYICGLLAAVNTFVA